jgi:dolichol-phosphate mannosyltransferase
VLNEAHHIQPLWDRITFALGSRPFRVCFVDDGSRDGTLEMLQRLQKIDPRVHLISRVKRQRGSQRGGALHAAMNWALEDMRHHVFVEMDGDLSHRPEELPLGIGLVEGGTCDVAIASKYLPDSTVTNRPWGRRAVSVICNTAVRALLSSTVRDYSNGFRFYNRRAAELLSTTHIRYGSPIYLTEAMAIWLRAGLRMREFPTTYVGRGEGLSKLRKRDLIKAAVGIFEIAARYRAGFKPAQSTVGLATPSAASSDIKVC